MKRESTQYITINDIRVALKAFKSKTGINAKYELHKAIKAVNNYCSSHRFKLYTRPDGCSREYRLYRNDLPNLRSLLVVRQRGLERVEATTRRTALIYTPLGNALFSDMLYVAFALKYKTNGGHKNEKPKKPTRSCNTATNNHKRKSTKPTNAKGKRTRAIQCKGRRD